MRRPPAPPWLYTAFTLVLWAVVLPGILARGQDGGFTVAWRSPPVAGLGAVVLAAGAALVHLAGRQLVRSRVGLFGVSPGPHLVTTNWYSRIRNPMDVGTTTVTLGAWLILAVPLMWVVPLAAVVNFVVGVGLYEDRRLLEEFGEEYVEYRARVKKWVPRRSAGRRPRAGRHG